MQSPRIQVIVCAISFNMLLTCSNPKRFIDDAECHRDTTAAMKLVPFIEQDPPVPDLQRILSWLYANLRPHKISGLQTVGSPEMALVIDSLRCLVAIKVHVENGLYAHIVRDLEKNWPNIWKCMDVIHAQTVEDTHSELSIRLLAGRSNLNVLVLFASHDHLRQIAGTTPGVVAMLMRLSYLEVTTSSHTSNHTYGAVGVLNFYLRIIGHQSPPRWEEEVIVPMGCVKSVARIALAQLSFHISLASRDVFRLAHMVNKINHITHLSNHKPIRNALIAQRSIRVLVDALESLLNHPMDDESMEYMSRCISNACNCLRGHIFAIDGITGIIEAFEANVLPVLLGCADMLETDDCAYFSLLCEDLPKYIIYPSVFRAANKSLKKFDSTTVDSYEFQSPRLQRVWAAYSRFKFSMDEIEMIKEVGVGHGIEVCANQTACLIFQSSVSNQGNSFRFLVP